MAQAVPLDWTQLAFWALITGGTPLVLLAVPYLRNRISDRTMHLMLGLSAGILGGLATLDILPESFAAAADAPGLPPQAVPLGVAAGFFLLFLVERHVLKPEGAHPHFENGKTIRSFGSLVVSALTVHGTMDGFVIPLGFAVSNTVGTIIVIAVALHQIPDSFAAMTVGLVSGVSRRTALAYVAATAADTPIGMVLGVVFLTFGTAWLPLGLAFSAGTFLFVSAADLIPELQHRSRSFLVTLSVVAGFVIVLLLTALPGA
ncbi:MAG TPA: ZIP family metal transporter [Thermoplasmata archaeon]|nr:ZIP family metal transporter [Thermoplasmata archaeon]